MKVAVKVLGARTVMATGFASWEYGWNDDDSDMGFAEDDMSRASTSRLVRNSSLRVVSRELREVWACTRDWKKAVSEAKGMTTS